MKIPCRRRWSLLLPLALAARFIATTEVAKAAAVDEAVYGPQAASMLNRVDSADIAELHKLLLLPQIESAMIALPTGSAVLDVLRTLNPSFELDSKLAGLVAGHYPGGAAAYNAALVKALASKEPEKDFNAAHLVSAHGGAAQPAEELLAQYGAHLLKARSEDNLVPGDPVVLQNLDALGRFASRNQNLAASYAFLASGFDGQHLQPQIHVIEQGDMATFLEDPKRSFSTVVFFVGENGEGSVDFANLIRIAPDFKPRLEAAIPKPGNADIVPTDAPHNGNFKKVMLFPFNPGDSMKDAAHTATWTAATMGAKSIVLIFPSGTSDVPSLMVSGAKAFNHDQESIYPTFLGHVFLAAYNPAHTAGLQQALHPKRVSLPPPQKPAGVSPLSANPPSSANPTEPPPSAPASGGASLDKRKYRQIPLPKVTGVTLANAAAAKAAAKPAAAKSSWLTGGLFRKKP